MHVKVKCNDLAENQKVLDFCEKNNIACYDIIPKKTVMEKQKSNLKKEIENLEKRKSAILRDLMYKQNEIEKCNKQFKEAFENLRTILITKNIIEKEASHD